MFNQTEALLRRITALEKKVQQLEDDQIKQNRDYKDMMYNLDTDNIPKLQAVVKKVNLVVSEDGNVTAEFIMEVVNNSSNAEIRADRIVLDGGTVLLGSKIKATEDGKITVESAEIKRDCILASDIKAGEAMQIGKPYNSNWANIRSLLRLFETSGAMNKGFEFVAQELDEDGKTVTEKSVEMSNNYARLLSNNLNSGDFTQAYVYGDEAYLEANIGDHTAGVYVDGNSARLQFDNVYLQVDGQGVHCGNGKNTMEVYQAL